METCNKKIKHTMRDVGVYATSICGKPVHDKGMCQGHYNRWVEKMIPWGEREGYRQATQEDLDKMRTMKLSKTHVHRLFKQKHGAIYEWKDNNYSLLTDLPLDPNLFTVKI